MNKKKIIISITSVLFALLTILGLAYAYYLTQITGNDSEYSVRATTARLELVYNDNNNVIAPVGVIVPGTLVGTKTFTVYNSGDLTTTYGVYLEDIINPLVRTEDLKYTLTCSGSSNTTCNGTSGDFPNENALIITNSINTNITQTYTLTIEYVDANADQISDMNKTFSGKVNIYNDNAITLNFSSSNGSYIVLERNSDNVEKLGYKKNNNYKFVGIEADTYTLKMYDSSDSLIATKVFTINLGSSLEISNGTNGKVLTITRIGGEYTVALDQSNNLSTVTNSINPYTSNTNLLSYNIINNSIGNTNGSIFRATPLTTPLKQGSLANEKELSVANDGLTNNSYYFRGNVTDNYLNFAGMCWRIVRIEGDGSIKLILEDSTYECNSSSFTGNWTIGNTIFYCEYTDYSLMDCPSESILDNELVWHLVDYQTTLNTKIGNKYNNKGLSDYLRSGNWCVDNEVIASGTNYWYYDENGEQVEDPEDAVDTESIQYTTYASYTRIYDNETPSLVCGDTKTSSFNDGTPMYVGSLTVDEAAFGGADTTGIQDNIYLYNNYARNNDISWWTLSPIRWNEWDGIEGFGVGGSYISSGVNLYEPHARPSIVLKANTVISGGIGTKDQPYIIS